MNEFFIPYTLPSLNQVIDTNRSHRMAGAKQKKDVQAGIETVIMAARLTPVDYPVIIEIAWQEPNEKRDVDNIQSSKKFILDSLVEMRILPNDGRKWVKQIHDYVVTNKKSPGVWVKMRRADDGEN